MRFVAFVFEQGGRWYGSACVTFSSFSGPSDARQGKLSLHTALHQQSHYKVPKLVSRFSRTTGAFCYLPMSSIYISVTLSTQYHDSDTIPMARLHLSSLTCSITAWRDATSPIACSNLLWLVEESNDAAMNSQPRGCPGREVPAS